MERNSQREIKKILANGFFVIFFIICLTSFFVTTTKETMGENLKTDEPKSVHLSLPLPMNFELSKKGMKFWEKIFERIQRKASQNLKENISLVIVFKNDSTKIGWLKKYYKIETDSLIKYYSEVYNGLKRCTYIFVYYNYSNGDYSNGDQPNLWMKIAHSGKCNHEWPFTSQPNTRSIDLASLDEISKALTTSNKLFTALMKKRDYYSDLSPWKRFLLVMKKVVTFKWVKGLMNNMFENGCCTAAAISENLESKFNQYCKGTFGEFPKSEELGTDKYNDYFSYFKDKNSEANKIMFILAHVTNNILNNNFKPLKANKEEVGQSTSFEASAENKENKVILIKGELTALGEGVKFNDNSIGIPLKIYWPGGYSGVTISLGYDLGGRKKSEVSTTLQASGLDKNKVAIITNNLVGLKKNEAKEAVEKLMDKIGELPANVLLKLYKKAYQEKLSDTKWRATKFFETYYKSESILKKYQLSEEQWNNLNEGIKELITDLRYQGLYRDYKGEIGETERDGNKKKEIIRRNTIAKINSILLFYNDSLFDQLIGLGELFVPGGYFDSLTRILWGRDPSHQNEKETFYGQEIHLDGTTFKRNAIRLAYIKYLINNLENGKTIKYYDTNTLKDKICFYKNNKYGLPISNNECVAYAKMVKSEESTPS